MQSFKRAIRRKKIAALCAAGFLCQLCSCDFGQISTTMTTTLDGREVIISLIRGAILEPIDQFITDAVYEFFGDEDD
jgi:hypothetical protein